MAVCRFSIFIENMDQVVFFLQGRKGCGHVGSWRETLGTPGLSGLAFFVHDMFSCCRFSNLAFFLQLGSRDVIRHVVKKGTVVV